MKKKEGIRQDARDAHRLSRPLTETEGVSGGADGTAPGSGLRASADGDGEDDWAAAAFPPFIEATVCDLARSNRFSAATRSS
jgi:hypothetical protein